MTGRYGKGERFDPKTDYRATMPQFTDAAMDQNRALLALLRRMAEEKSSTPAQISLAWMLCKKPWIVPIPGTRRPERMQEMPTRRRCASRRTKCRRWMPRWTA